MVDLFEVSKIKSHSSFINIMFYCRITDAKGINLGKTKVTEGITNWIAEKGYVLEGTNLNVR